MNRQQFFDVARNVLAEAGAVLTHSHFVYTSGKHGSAYVNKDAIYTNPQWLDALCTLIAVRFQHYPIEVVLAPAVGGVNLATSVARELRKLTGQDVRCVHAEHQEESLAKGPRSEPTVLLPGEELLIKKPKFGIKRGYDKLIAGKHTLVVEDVLTTGGSARETVRAGRVAGASIGSAAVICNRGNVTNELLDIDELFALMDIEMDAYDEETCPLCANGVRINTEVGKGKQFLARKAQNA